MAQELAGLSDAPWTAHFNQGYHDGGWSGLALLAVDADPTQLLCRDLGSSALQPTVWLQRCPLLSAWLQAFPAPLRSARLLRLAPGAVIREHRDYDIGLPRGLVRVHLPIVSPSQVEFHVDGVRVAMRAGECWYLDLSLPHRVRNDSPDEARIHLVVDCEVNAALQSLLPTGEAALAAEAEVFARQAAAPEGARERLERFLARALEDRALLDRLQVLAAESFDVEVSAAGAAMGLRFDADEVRAARQQGQRRWLEQRGL